MFKLRGTLPRGKQEICGPFRRITLFLGKSRKLPPGNLTWMRYRVSDDHELLESDNECCPVFDPAKGSTISKHSGSTLSCLVIG
jgi:hypothetical protein